MSDHFRPFNEKQLQFLKDFQETIEFGMLEGQFLKTWHVINKLKDYQPYRELFSRYDIWYYLNRYFDECSTIDLRHYHLTNQQLREIFQIEAIDPETWDIKEPQDQDVFNQLQLTFLNRYRDAIIVGSTANKFWGNWRIIDILLEWDAYKVLMYRYRGWDDVLDYFEDSSVYNREFRRNLENQLRALSSWF